MAHHFNQDYSGENLNRVAFPLGGMGAGMFCMEGSGALTHVCLRHRPEVFNEPWFFAAVHLGGAHKTARLLQGPVPDWKVLFPWSKGFGGSANGSGERLFGLPRFRENRFESQFPFATAHLADPALPLKAAITAWSPFVPGDPDNASLPVACLEYCLNNSSDEILNLVFSFHARNFMQVPKARGDSGVSVQQRGFTLWQKGDEQHPWHEGALCVEVPQNDVAVNADWFNGGWFDTMTMLWKSVENGELPRSAAQGNGSGMLGGSLYVALELAPHTCQTVPLNISWYVPASDISVGHDHLMSERDGAKVCLPSTPRYVPWYAGAYDSLESVRDYWRSNVGQLRSESDRFRAALYESTLPAQVLEAVGANLSILKSPTCLRQSDGRFWAWEGCCDTEGCCHGSCTHVWNYAQALPHLFAQLERGLRTTEFFENQDSHGHQNFRTNLPISTLNAQGHVFHAAADGQLGGIMKVHREWRVGGDTEWLKRLWPAVRASLDYCQRTWDPDSRGVLTEPHHNTYDIEFWGANSMCSSFYLGALKAASILGRELGEDISCYDELYSKGRAFMENELYNGEYFIQKTQWTGLQAKDPIEVAAQGIGQNYSAQARVLLEREGPKYQYGDGCLSDGVLGAWMAQVCGVGEILDNSKVESHLLAVYRHNFRSDLSAHANPQRGGFALNSEGGLVLCSWPRGGAPSLPLVYGNEVWTGIEYQVASHLMIAGHVEKGCEIVSALRSRHNGKVRNPFDEYECGHWYARALASWALLQSLTGIVYDKVDRTLTIAPRIPGDFSCFFATDGPWGVAGVRKGEPYYEVRHGALTVDSVDYRAAP